MKDRKWGMAQGKISGKENENDLETTGGARTYLGALSLCLEHRTAFGGSTVCDEDEVAVMRAAEAPGTRH